MREPPVVQEQWIHGAKPLTATSRHLLQSLPIDTAGLDPEGAMQLVMVQVRGRARCGATVRSR